MIDQKSDNPTSPTVSQDLTAHMSEDKNTKIQKTAKKLSFWLFFISIPILVVCGGALISAGTFMFREGRGAETWWWFLGAVLSIALIAISVLFRIRIIVLNNFKKMSFITAILCTIAIPYFAFFVFFLVMFVFFVGLGYSDTHRYTSETDVLLFILFGMVVACTIFQIFVFVQCFIKCIRLLRMKNCQHDLANEPQALQNHNHQEMLTKSDVNKDADSDNSLPQDVDVKSKNGSSTDSSSN